MRIYVGGILLTETTSQKLKEYMNQAHDSELSYEDLQFYSYEHCWVIEEERHVPEIFHEAPHLLAPTAFHIKSRSINLNGYFEKIVAPLTPDANGVIGEKEINK